MPNTAAHLAPTPMPARDGRQPRRPRHAYHSCQSRHSRRLPWPAPALLTWLAAWALVYGLLRAGPALGCPAALAWLAAAGLGLAVATALRGASGWRRLITAAGFPLSALASGLAQGVTLAGVGGVPAWVWLLPLAALLAAYPLRAWRDAPLFPTPLGALAGLAALAPLPPGASVLDAGCGLGHGLAALRSAYAGARIHGIEWSGLLRLAAAARCPWASVRRADMWAADWSAHGLVYLFQRPESMARALAKAQAEMAPGSWLASLEFAVPGVPPSAVLQAVAGKPVWLYQVAGTGAAGLAPVHPAAQAAQPASPAADNPVNKPAHPGRR